MNEVIVTSTRTASKMGNVAVPVQVISQKTIKQTPKNIKIEMHVHINPELCNRLLSMGPYCKVIQPVSLKKQIKTLLQNTLKNYIFYSNQEKI